MRPGRITAGENGVTMKVRTIVGSLATTAVMLMGVGCATPSGPASSWAEVCVPSGWVLRGDVNVTFVGTPPGSSLSWTYLVEIGSPGDPGHDVNTLEFTENAPVGGTTLKLTFIDPGRCIHLTPSGGLTYTATIVPTLTTGGSFHGFQPGWTGPPAP